MKRKNRLFTWATGVVLSLVVFIGAGSMFSELKLFSATKPAPDFLDMTLEEAVKKAGEEGFNIEQKEDCYSSDFAEGRICSQNPEPGMEIKKGTMITINLSKGSKEGVVPNVIGMSESDATATLERYGFSIGNRTMVHDREEQGVIIEQNPKGGVLFDKEGRIDLVLSGDNEL